MLGLNDDDAAGARRAVRLMLADPLSDKQAWEYAMEKVMEQPVMVRIGGQPRERQSDKGVLVKTERSGELVHELVVDSPVLRGHEAEVLVMRANFAEYPSGATAEDVEEVVLVPMVDIPADTKRTFPIRAPVHRVLLFSRGVGGVARVFAVPAVKQGGMVSAAVDLQGYAPHADENVPFQWVDVPSAQKALDLFRQGPQYAIEYERLWHQSNMPGLASWMKQIVDTPTGATKPVVRQLIESVLRNTLARLALEERRHKVRNESAVVPPNKGLQTISDALKHWAQAAHTELQDQLDVAFTSHEWRMLRWWKLFWRVDDVTTLTGTVLASNFLSKAERELVYLAGRMEQAAGTIPVYMQPVASGSKNAATTLAQDSAAVPSSETLSTLADSATSSAISSATSSITPSAVSTSTPSLLKWPFHISHTRTYLATTTVPALHALAQRLVLEAYATSSAAAAVAGLVWTSWSLYEAGAAAALGLVWAARRMQRRWDGARTFWEAEVREEGRKALRGVERSVLEKVDELEARENIRGDLGDDEINKAKELVEKARVALERMR